MSISLFTLVTAIIGFLVITCTSLPVVEKSGADAGKNKRYTQLFKTTIDNNSAPEKCSPPQSKINELLSLHGSEDIFANIISINRYIEGYVVSNSSEDADIDQLKCTKMQELLQNSIPKRSKVLCPWKYYCDYKQERFPPYIVSAACSTTNCDNCGNVGRCLPYYITIKVLKLDNEEACNATNVDDLWRITSHRIEVGCECKPHETNVNVIVS